jgi:hypothetical protein
MVTLARNLVPDILCPTRLPCPQENNPRHTENLQSLVAGRLSLMHHRHPSPHNFRVSVLPGSVSRFQNPSIIIIINFPFTCSLSHAIFLLPGVTHKKAGWVRLAQSPYRPWYRVVDDESTKEYMQSIHDIYTSASCHIHAHPGITNTRRACRTISSPTIFSALLKLLWRCTPT